MKSHLESKNYLRRRSAFEQLERRELMVADWQNSVLACDVDSSGIVTPFDALVLINSINSSGARSLAGSIKSQNLPFYDVNGDNSINHLDVLVVINAINRAMPDLTVESNLVDTQDADKNGVVSSDAVELRGVTSPNSTVRLRVTLGNGSVINSTLKSDTSGQYTVHTPLNAGVNRISVHVLDELGRTSEVIGQITKGSVVAEWNATILNEVRKLSQVTANEWTPPQAVQTKPPGIARNLAMIYTAMFDAVNSISGGYDSFLTSLPSNNAANAVAAATAAAHRVASSLYSDAESVLAFDATFNESLKLLPDNEARRQGLELGRSVADAMLARRANDGSSVTLHPQFGSSPGEWKPLAPVFEAVLPQWPNVSPFVAAASGFPVEPPPALTSSAYAQAVDEVMRLGSINSTQRTSDQTEIAKFWADGSGTASPPGHWNQITSDVLATKQMSLIEELRTMALVNIAMADSGIASWKAKYDHNLWRPIDAIRGADVDSNPATNLDSNWTPLINTPPFPAYVSGHSTFSSAASAVLTSLFGPNVSFASQADTAAGWLPVAAERSPKVRTFNSFGQAAEEAGLSRIYGGIHFNFDNTEGAELGSGIGSYVVNNALKKRF